MAAAVSNKYFQYAREVNLYSEQSPTSTLAELKVVPSYILVGDQSSGKTTLLSRLAGLPLGYTVSGTGTRRPFEYNLFHDETKEEPEVEVNSQKIPEEQLLRVMTEKNGTEGFNQQAVSVKILWKYIKSSMIITDMPGTKDGDDAPEKMILERLKKENVIPVVILKPRDFGSKHYPFTVLKKAKREYKDIIVVVNKCDEKMTADGEWADAADWAKFWESASSKGFKKIFFVGWPCQNRNTTNVKDQKAQLSTSWEDERARVEPWKVKAKVEHAASEMIGLERFQRQLNQDQTERLHELHERSIKEVQAEQDVIKKKLHYLENSKECDKELSRLFTTWSHDVNKILKGCFTAAHHMDHCSTAEQDLAWLFGEGEGRRQFKELDRHDRHRKATETLLEKDLFRITPLAGDGQRSRDAGSWIDLIANSVSTVYEPLMGKSALERILDVALAAALARLFQHALTEFDTTFISNIWAESSEDTGNKVIMQFVDLVLTDSLHPLVDVTCLLVWKHLETCFTKSFKEWKEAESAQMKDLKIDQSFDRAAKAYAKDLVRELNKDLHERLEEQRFRPQGRCRSGPRSLPLAFNFSGVNTHANGEAGDFQVGHQSVEDEFCSTCLRFLKMGIQTLSEADHKCQQARRFYHVLLSSMLPLDTLDKLPAAEVFPEASQSALGVVELDASVGAKRELRSLPLRVRKGHAIVLELQARQEDKDKAPKVESNKEGCQPGWFGGKDRRAPLSLRGCDETDVQATPCVTVSLVDLNKDGAFESLGWDPAKETSVCFKADKLADHCHKLVHVDVACSGYKLSILSVSFEREKQREQPEESSPPSSTASFELAYPKEHGPKRVRCGTMASAEDAPAAEDETVEAFATGTGKGQIKFAQDFLESVKSRFKALPRTVMAGMSLRKLHADASYELVEQAIFFRDLLEKRLEKLKETVHKDLAHQMITRVGRDVIEGLEKERKKKCKKLQKQQLILAKAMALHREICPLEAGSDSGGD